MQSLVRFLYPYSCLTCDEQVEQLDGFCPSCWSQMEFIRERGCHRCGRPLQGDVEEGDCCDACTLNPPAWSRGRALFVRKETGARFISMMGRGDKASLVKPAGRWLARDIASLVESDTLLVPVPRPWFQSVRLRFNPSVLLSQRLSRELSVEHCPDALRVGRASGFEVRPAREARIKGRKLLLVDDVLNTGKTLDACAKACMKSGAAQVSIAVLGVVAKDR